MSAQLIELIIFAVIAFLVINKLIATLGITAEDDPTKNKSFFGEARSKMKDVTNTVKAKKSNVIKTSFKTTKTLSLKDLIVKENEKDIKSGLMELVDKLPSFNPSRFLKNAKTAFKMMLSANNKDSNVDLEELVDKRYLEQFQAITKSYGKYTATKTGLAAHISEIYLFGNNIFIKILFTGKNITSKVKEMHEEWTFTKSCLNNNPNWQLTNIDRPQ